MVSSQALQEGTGQLSGRQRLLFAVRAQRVGRGHTAAAHRWMSACSVDNVYTCQL